MDYQTISTRATPKAERDKLNIGDIWANQVKCLRCEEVIRSMNRHDFRWCSCGQIAVDGGSMYLRRVGKLDGYEELSESYDDAVEPSRSTAASEKAALGDSDYE